MSAKIQLNQFEATDNSMEMNLEIKPDAVPLQEKSTKKKKGWRRFLSFFRIKKSKSNVEEKTDIKDVMTAEPEANMTRIPEISAEVHAKVSQADGYKIAKSLSEMSMLSTSSVEEIKTGIVKIKRLETIEESEEEDGFPGCDGDNNKITTAIESNDISGVDEEHGSEMTICSPTDDELPSIEVPTDEPIIAETSAVYTELCQASSTDEQIPDLQNSQLPEDAPPVSEKRKRLSLKWIFRNPWSSKNRRKLSKKDSSNNSSVEIENNQAIENDNLECSKKLEVEEVPEIIKTTNECPEEEKAEEVKDTSTDEIESEDYLPESDVPCKTEIDEEFTIGDSLNIGSEQKNDLPSCDEISPINDCAVNEVQNIAEPTAMDEISPLNDNDAKEIQDKIEPLILDEISSINDNDVKDVQSIAGPAAMDEIEQN